MKCKEHKRTLRYLLLLYRSLNRTKLEKQIRDEILQKYEPQEERAKR